MSDLLRRSLPTVDAPDASALARFYGGWSTADDAQPWHRQMGALRS
ncbi:hypothetical protein BJZ21_003593 [Nocardioides panaciterrulae]|uniref:Uncharacterized protein n=1 Tax=Nocardioides panaciterrulae TaxID=661492 RepID=A0A7Y9JC06_9ACTN|nr:hypothetical protein [Nocardioides panaciterrulae]